MQEFSANVNGNQFTGLQWGDTDKPIILALHGWLDNAASFIPLADSLEAKMVSGEFPYQIIAIDLPGHGKSFHKVGHYHFVDWIDDIYQLINSQNWRNITLLGHSMGAMICSIFAATFPEMIKSVILVEGLGAISAKPEQTLDQLKRGIKSRIDYYPNTDEQPIKQLSLDRVVKARCRISDLSAENARLICNRNLTPCDGGFNWSSDAKLKSVSLLRFTDKQVLNFLSNISMPCAIIKATKGFPLISEVLELDIFKHENFVIHELTGGHHVHMEQAQLLGDILQNNVTQ